MSDKTTESELNVEDVEWYDNIFDAMTSTETAYNEKPAKDILTHFAEAYADKLLGQESERTSETTGEVSPLKGIVSVLERVIESAIPSNWLDPLLTGEDNVIGEAPYTPKDIERLLNAVKKRLKQHVEAEAVEIE